MSGLNVIFRVASIVSFLLYSGYAVAAQLSISTEVQDNIKILTETKICPQCNLSGANLNRLDLSGANLEGAILSRATLALSDLSGANLQKADLRETIFNGADLGNADLRGADLTGSSLVGAYMKGILIDGEILETRPYAEHEEISEVQEIVYVEDTANSKTPKSPEDITIVSRRDFEETPPVLHEEMQVSTIVIPTQEDDTTQVIEGPDEVVALEAMSTPVSIPQQSAPAPAAKIAAPIPDVHIEKVVVDEGIQSVQEEQAAPVIAVVTTAAVAASKPEPKPKPKPELQQDVQVETAAPESDVSIIEQSVVESTSIAPIQTETEEASDIPGKVAPVEPETTEQVDEELGMMDSAVGMVTGLFNSSNASSAPQTMQMINAAMLFDSNKCYGCDLSGVDLSGVDLEDADLESANLQGANLKGADLQSANLKGANLSGADLSGADLSEADLYRAILKGADLTEANLEEAKLDDVDLSQAKGYQKQAIMLME